MRAIPAAGFALLALAVAAVGVMATLSTLVAERRRDLATPARRWRFPRAPHVDDRAPGAGADIGGVAGGLAAGALAARGLASMLYGVTPHDAVTFGGTAALILSISMVMTAVAATRALRIDPIAVLRQDA